MRIREGVAGGLCLTPTIIRRFFQMGSYIHSGIKEGQHFGPVIRERVPTNLAASATVERTVKREASAKEKGGPFVAPAAGLAF